MGMKKKLKITEALAWADQQAHQKVEWAKIKTTLTQREEEALSEGVKDGFMQAIHTLKLHGFIELE